jgi:hypothetical protein
MAREEYISLVREIMMKFAALSGLSPAKKHPRRYLWTDAFAVCNFLELYTQTGDAQYRDLAIRLVNQVHTVLGKHREDDLRKGWISGLSEKEGEQHPTRGGLRIGKKLNERKPGAPITDDRLEWDQDGQYFHYLTKWMHALNRMCIATEDLVYNRWAIELARAAHTGFVYASSISGQKRMYWKVSIDLSYPLVPSMGQHDPLDGLVTYCQLQATAKKDPNRCTSPDLVAEIADMAAICTGRNWATDDPLGIGGLLSDAYRVAQLMINEDFEGTALFKALLESSLEGLKLYMRDDQLRLPADYRLAFRELGLSIGSGAIERIRRLVRREAGRHNITTGGTASLVNSLMVYAPLRETIEAFWLQEVNQESESWKNHLDINMVMLATSLAPDGYLTL